EGANDIVFAPPAFPDGLNTGVCLGFHGRFNAGGTSNEENPVVYANPRTGAYFHFIAGQQAGIGHLDGLLATRDSLFVADLVTTGTVGSQIELIWDRGVLQEAEEVTGSWNDVVDAFSPHRVQPAAFRKFYRTRY